MALRGTRCRNRHTLRRRPRGAPVAERVDRSRRAGQTRWPCRTSGCDRHPRESRVNNAGAPAILSGLVVSRSCMSPARQLGLLGERGAAAIARTAVTVDERLASTFHTAITVQRWFSVEAYSVVGEAVEVGRELVRDERWVAVAHGDVRAHRRRRRQRGATHGAVLPRALVRGRAPAGSRAAATPCRAA